MYQSIRYQELEIQTCKVVRTGLHAAELENKEINNNNNVIHFDAICSQKIMLTLESRNFSSR